HPALADDAQALLDLLQAEMLYRLDSGDRPILDEYLKRFPQYADGLRRAWTLLQMTRPRPGSDSSQADSTAAEPPDPSLPNRRAGPAPQLPGLALYEKLGEGGMGIVYRARDVRLDQPRAVKLIRSPALASEDSRERFEREARAVARLD